LEPQPYERAASNVDHISFDGILRIQATCGGNVDKLALRRVEREDVGVAAGRADRQVLLDVCRDALAEREITRGLAQLVNDAVLQVGGAVVIVGNGEEGVGAVLVEFGRMSTVGGDVLKCSNSLVALLYRMMQLGTLYDPAWL
jgi:hypothetical protein